MPKIVALAGGVGGAKLAHGLAQCVPASDLTVIVNTGDDFEHLGLTICPDLDTVMYTLAGLANPETGWGLAGETWNFLSAVKRLGGATWFRLGDHDLATHVERTHRLRAGDSLTTVTRALCQALRVGPRVLPMCDAPVRTWVMSDEGELPFQEYFVHRQCRPIVSGFRFIGAESAALSASVSEALSTAEVVVVCPSNPFVSVEPVLSVPGMRDRLAAKRVVAVSPIIGGQAVKGPAAKMLAELNFDVSALGVARYYARWVQHFVLDTVDAALAPEIANLGLRVLTTNTLMKSDADRARLARTVLDFVLS